MEKNKIMKLLGITLIFIGFLFILNASSGITGFAVAESIGRGISGIIGLVLIIGGVVVFISANNKKNLEEIKNIPTRNMLKAIKEMENCIKSGKRYTPNETSRLLGKAGYSLIPVRGDHMKVVRDGEDIRNPPNNKRPNSIIELDMGSKSHNPGVVIRGVLYDFKERQFRDFYSDQSS